ncbi:hypothetical protein, partial [Burkholderia ubonensis]|uniref:hypothetical protein n=1 Tax=Burkholderia ubonensis TaxID=101571 RepID=UPI001E60F626
MSVRGASMRGMWNEKNTKLLAPSIATRSAGAAVRVKVTLQSDTIASRGCVDACLPLLDQLTAFGRR